MGFLLFISVCAVIWLLWNICRNTNDALDKQTAIQYEIVSLEKRLEELLDKLAEQRGHTEADTETKTGNQPAKKPEAPVEQEKPDAKLVENSDKVNINTGSIRELTSLPRIGSVMAQNIIDARPYQVAQDLLRVKGISRDILSEFESRIEF
ncbi:MAG: hypothetical protein CSB48_04920 [Proteobacteria bacterium]|nr:MAG: hypothetical protein CSB48_04920 [Pseudomonadota bacterium]